MTMTIESRTSPAQRQQPRTDIPSRLTRRAIVDRVRPTIDGGRFAIKRTLGDQVHVFADIFADGHDAISCVLRDRHVGSQGNAEHAELAERKTGSAGSASGTPKGAPYGEGATTRAVGGHR